MITPKITIYMIKVFICFLDFNFLLEITGILIQLFAGFATFWAANSTYKTVIEMKSQRDDKYRVDLHILSHRIFIHLYKSGKYEYPILIKKKHKKLSLKDSSPILLSWLNLGPGIAKEIRYQFNFDMKLATEILNEQNKRNYYKFDLNHHYLRILSHDLRDLKFLTPVSTQHEVEFILPYHDKNEHEELYLDEDYIIVRSMFDRLFFLNALENPEIDFSVYDQFPKLYLTLHYKDIFNKDHTCKFEVNTYLNHTNLNLTEKSHEQECGEFILSFKKINC